MKYKKNYFNIQKGFTLIEVIAAMFVITVGVVGALIAIQQTMFYTQTSVSRLTATYLAQEGIEIVRNIRDGNWLELNPIWDDGLTGCEPEGVGCQADYSNNQSLDSFTGNLLKIDGGFYQYSSGTSTPFTRKITITKPEAKKIEVEVTVRWDGREVTAQESLYNWRKY